MKNIWKSFKKSEVAIYAIAIMLVAAGYLNYSTMNKELATSETYSEDIQNIAESDNSSNIGDATLVNSNDVIENNTITENIVEKEVDENSTESETQNTSSNTVIEENSIVENNVNEDNTVNEELETSSQEVDNSGEDYFTSSKLNRDTTYASMLSNYTSILERDNVSESEKQIAMQEITNINNTKNAIMICENILSTKDIDDCVIFVNDDSINVVVKLEGGLTKEKVAQIQNIVSRELDTEIANIHITEK